MVNLNYFCRNYDEESERQKGVEEFYRSQHINQTYDFVSKSYYYYYYYLRVFIKDNHFL